VATNPTRPAPSSSARRPFWRSRGFWIYVVALLVLNYLFSTFITSGPTRITVPYTTFVEQVTAGNVKSITAQSNSIQGEFKRPVTSGSQSGTLFQTERPVFAQDNLGTLLQEQNVPITATAPGSGQSPLLSLLLGFGPVLLLVGAFIYISQRAGGGAGGIHHPPWGLAGRPSRHGQDAPGSGGRR
jgi:cell division protease FtsH